MLSRPAVRSEVLVPFDMPFRRLPTSRPVQDELVRLAQVAVAARQRPGDLKGTQGDAEVGEDVVPHATTVFPARNVRIASAARSGSTASSGVPLAAGRQSGTSAVAGSVEDGEVPVDELGGLALDVGVFVRQWEVGPSRRRRGPSRSVRASCPTTVLRATPTRRVLDPRCSGLRTTPSREQPEVHAPRSSGVCG